MSRLPPAEKIPLAVRKNVRDKWDANKESLEEDLSKAAGVSWKIDINPNAIYPYAKEGTYAQESLGSALSEYVKGAISGLGRFKYKFGETGLKDLNVICHARTLTLDADVSGAVETNGVDVVDGKLRLLFAPESINSNITNCLDQSKLENALNAAELPAEWGSTLSFNAKNSIDNDYTKRIDEIQTGIADVLNNKDIKLVPNFEDTFQKLKSAVTEQGTKLAVENWETYLGAFTAEYFKGVKSNLQWLGFGKDDLLQEGFNEAVDKNQIVFRIVSNLKNEDASNECVIEEGTLYIQVTPSKWGRNISGAGDKIVDLL